VDWQSGLAGMGLCLVGVIGYKLVAILIRATARRWGKSSPARRAFRRGTDVAFYKRLESVLASHGFRRHATQTPHEFAVGVESTLSRSLPTNGVQTIPLRVVDAYYDVRFGDRPLAEDQASALDQAITALAKSLKDSARQRAHRQSG
jgi:hypothetical protein